jgi:ribosomal protein L7Ae-like RNA K-turn-binding protein
MIAEGALEGLFYIPEDVSPQHVTTTLDALKSVKNISAKQFY